MAEQHARGAKSGIVVYDASFHQGIVGIVAGRLREKFHKPAVVFADAGGAAEDELKGSARSVAGLHVRDVFDAMAASHPGLLVKFGGHAMAAGLSIKRVHLDRFGVVFDKTVTALADPEALQASYVTDGVLEQDQLTVENAWRLREAGPWGSGFPEPSFAGEFEVVSARVVGEQHLKMVLKTNNRVVDAIAFRHPELASGTRRIHAVYRLDVNDYGQYPTLQLVVEYLTALP